MKPFTGKRVESQSLRQDSVSFCGGPALGTQRFRGYVGRRSLGGCALSVGERHDRLADGEKAAGKVSPLVTLGCLRGVIGLQYIARRSAEESRLDASARFRLAHYLCSCGVLNAVYCLAVLGDLML